MKQAISLLVLSMAASAAVSANRFLSLTGGVPAAGANARGVTDAKAAQGERVPFTVIGTAVVETGGAIAAGALVETDNQGRAITKDSGATLARMAPDQAAASGAGQFVEVVLITN